MTRDQKLMAIAGALIVLGLMAALPSLRRSPAAANLPDGAWWICSNNECKHEFVMSAREISNWQHDHYGEPIPCPKCGHAPAQRALKCKECGTVYPALNATQCPKCGAKPE